ncbi:hypothetical protein LY76DRAFT_593742 [Colletotrichum caudatum]|nr:hypothetical protein LY76DRAFT_593742 [Colletotrichum caudatum]
MGSPLVPAVVAVGLVRAGESEASGPHVYRPLCDTGASPSRILKPAPRLFAMRVPLAPMQIHPRQSSPVQSSPVQSNPVDRRLQSTSPMPPAV